MKIKRFINSKTILIFTYLILAFSIGLVLGLKIGYTDGARNTIEIRNQILDIKPYDASLEIKNLEYSDITSAGFTVHFDTPKTTGSTIYFDDINKLVVQWSVYPSDIFYETELSLQVFDKPVLKAVIEKYPEGGTVLFRVIDTEQNYGSRWFYMQLPHPDESVLPPPYMLEPSDNFTITIEGYYEPGR
jgi:hypothetical protein